MAIPKGNYIALQPLKPAEIKVADFFSNKIDYLIKQDQAEKAAKIKAIQDSGKALMEANKDIKVDPLKTIPNLQQQYNVLVRDAMSSLADAKRMGENFTIPEEQRREAYRVARNKADNILMLGTYMSSPEDLKQFSDKLNTNPADIFQGDDSLNFFDAIKFQDFKLSFDENGNALVAYPNQDQKPDDPVEWKSLAEEVVKWKTPFEKNLTKETQDFMQGEAKNMYAEYLNGVGGNREVKEKTFLEDKAKNSFDINFGNYDANNTDPMLRQFSYGVLGSKFIQNEDDWNKVKQAWVDRMSQYVSEEKSKKDRFTPAQMEGQNLDNKYRKLQIANYGRDNSRGTQQNGALIDTNPVLSNGNSIVQIRDTKGNVMGTQTWNVNSVALPKVPGKPSTDNSFGVATFRDSKGVQRDTWLMGAPAEDGKMVYSKIPEKELNEYVTKLGYNPVVIKANLTSKERFFNKYSSQTIKNNIYKNTKINFKSKEVKDDDSTNGTGIPEKKQY